MRDYKSLFHTRWDCKYHIVFIPKMTEIDIGNREQGHRDQLKIQT